MMKLSTLLCVCLVLSAFQAGHSKVIKRQAGYGYGQQQQFLAPSQAQGLSLAPSTQMQSYGQQQQKSFESQNIVRENDQQQSFGQAPAPIQDSPKFQAATSFNQQQYGQAPAPIQAASSFNQQQYGQAPLDSAPIQDLPKLQAATYLYQQQYSQAPVTQAPVASQDLFRDSPMQSYGQQQQKSFESQNIVRENDQQQSYGQAPVAPAPIQDSPKFQAASSHNQQQYGQAPVESAPIQDSSKLQGATNFNQQQYNQAPLPQATSQDLFRDSPMQSYGQQQQKSFESQKIVRENDQQQSYGQAPVAPAPIQAETSFNQQQYSQAPVAPAPIQDSPKFQAASSLNQQQYNQAPLPQASSQDLFRDTPMQSYGQQQQKSFESQKIVRENDQQQSYGQAPVAQTPAASQDLFRDFSIQPFDAPKQQSYGQTKSSLVSSSGYQSYQKPAEPERPMSKLPNNCIASAKLEPIWQGRKIHSTYCRCSDNTIGRTCAGDSQYNPCATSNQQYHPADSSYTPDHFIECAFNIPFLFKCQDSLEWNQDIVSCDWPERKFLTTTTIAPETTEAPEVPEVPQLEARQSPFAAYGAVQRPVAPVMIQSQSPLMSQYNAPTRTQFQPAPQMMAQSQSQFAPSPY